MNKQPVIMVMLLACFLVFLPAQPQETAPADDAALRIEKARIKLVRKQFDQALEELNIARQMDPKNSEILNLMGIVHLQCNRYNTARTCFKRAISLNDKDPRAYNNLGSIYHTRKQYKTAIKYYKKAVEKDPKFLMAYYNLSNAYFSRKQYLQAVDTLHRLVQLDPEYLTKPRAGLEVSTQDEFDDPAKRNFFYAKLYAQAGNADKVIYFLQKSIESGFRDFKQIREDKDFAPFAQDPRFLALVPAENKK